MARSAMLVVFVLSGCFIYLDTPAEAALDCWQQAYNKWTGCDNAYSNTVYTYNNMNAYCSNNAANICSASANSYCSQQATTACQGNPDPQCYTNSYNGCYLSQYQSCHTQTTTQCATNVQNAYNNRGNSYGSCLGIEGNFGNCIEQVDGGCLLAQDRVTACYATYTGSEDGDALQLCILNSGIGQCQ